MATDTFNTFNDFTEQLAKGVHTFGTDTFKTFLANDLPAATDTIKANITEISAGNGYTAGGVTHSTVTVSETGGTTTVTPDNAVVTATGAIGPFQYAILYNDSATSPADALVGWVDYGSAVTMANGETFTVNYSSGAFTIS